MQQCLIKPIISRLGFCRRLCSSSNAAVNQIEEPKRWQLFSAAILERLPKLMKPLTEYEKDYRLYRHEAKLPFTRKMPTAWFPNGQREDPVTHEVLIGDFSRRNFTPASLETDADRSNNKKTLDRRLTDSIYFVVKRENRVWQFPQGEAEEGKMLIQTAEEALKNFVGNRITLHFVSNVPVCHVEREFSPEVKQQRKWDGAKIFFYRALVVEGNLEDIPFDYDFAWLSSSEMTQVLPSIYYNAVKNIL
ncbi:39S ribosomal protein L46, mitochondrial [Galdieria sulphuraria]|uniref:Mitochondrial ribosomal protein L46 n=1 Tax=Galdieria sulphuraria TaxID=130081 RepID=M2Y465_GALSU|nr:mitochondrial ribosomal protein L46 [Galdieria sulphuraria]EME30743.1 mitochondrial ribosomal protein L46 [Galdieria sulphuraria]GJD10817.1 39S ribosomal protein L46, mitochondrial [Galdieria sulphuraria]|eukprot:XP_005707263.1 mitochondrial ribosomal protein L46 [Galdieria sulphuraria]